jgi:hypothetical protein
LVQPANDSGIRQTVHIPEAAAQDIWVATNPPGAKAVIDGDASRGCATPCMLQAAPGVHHLIILQNGFLPEYREIHVGAEPQDLPEITLRKPFGTLMLTSNPPGASIYINGQPVPQVTPAQLSLPPGTYDVRVEKDGRSEAETVQLHQGPLYLRLPLDR